MRSKNIEVTTPIDKTCPHRYDASVTITHKMKVKLLNTALVRRLLRDDSIICTSVAKLDKKKTLKKD